MPKPYDAVTKRLIDLRPSDWLTLVGVPAEEAEVSPEEDRELWTAIQILMGLRFSEGFTTQLLQGVRHMRESVTYKAILQEGVSQGLAQGLTQGLKQGRVEEAQSMILRLGSKRFGEILPATQSAIEAIDSLERLKRLEHRLLDAANWEELLAS